MTSQEIKAHACRHPAYLNYPNARSARRYGISEEEWAKLKLEIRTGGWVSPSEEEIREEVGVPAHFKVRRAWQLPGGDLRYSFEAKEESPEDRESFREELLEDIRREMRALPEILSVPLFPDSGNLAVFHFCDLHIGKDAWTLEEAERSIKLAFEQAISSARLMRCERVHLVIGHDLLQIDYEHVARSGTLHTTSSGTPVTRSADSWRRLYRKARSILSWMVRRLLAEGFTASVDFIPGNHSEQSEIAMGDALQVQFEHEDRALIRLPEDGGYDLAFQWGSVGIMETHGHTVGWEELPLQFPYRYPELFCHSDYRYIVTGHKHVSRKRRVGDYAEERGCTVYISPSLSPQDAWHKKWGYDSLPGFDVFCYNRETGPIGHFQTRFPERSGRVIEVAAPGKPLRP